MDKTFRVSDIMGVVVAAGELGFPLPYVISSPGERRVEEGMVHDEFALRERLHRFPGSAVVKLGEELVEHPPQRFAVRTLGELYKLLRERRQVGRETFPVRLAPMPGRGNPPLSASTAKEAAERAKEAFRRSPSHTIAVEFC